MFKESFKDLVNIALINSNNFYKNPENINSPNPYFVGFGNPNAKILILGKEKGFDKNNLKQLEYESINNPSGARLQRVPTYLINENKAFATRVI